MRRKTLALGLFGALPASLVLLWLLSRGEQNPSTSAPAASASVALAAEVSRLERALAARGEKVDASEIGRLRDELEELRASLAQEGQARPAEAPGPKRTAEEGQAAEIEEMEQRMAAETADGEWSRPAQGRIADAVARMEGVELRDATCRQTMCRVELSHTDPSRRVEVLNDLKFTAPFNTEGFIAPGGTPEHPQSIVYVAREGHALPHPSPE